MCVSAPIIILWLITCTILQVLSKVRSVLDVEKCPEVRQAALTVLKLLFRGQADHIVEVTVTTISSSVDPPL